MNEQDPDEVLDRYSDTYLQCRTDRHRWGRQAQWFVADKYHNERHSVCQDCGTRRIWTINITTFQRVGYARYQYPKDYLTPRSGLVRGNFSEEMFRRDFTRAQHEHRVVVG